jgi:queuosine biosynthesis protein QueC
LAWAIDRFSKVETIGFDYRQRHRIELECRANVRRQIKAGFPDWAERLGEDHLLDVAVLGEISQTALTQDIAIALEADKLPNTFVPGRNILFFTLAAAVAYRRGIKHLIGGMCETDYSGYPDCRDDTLKALQVTLSLGMDHRFVIHTPLMWRDKAATCTRRQLKFTLPGPMTIVDTIADAHYGDKVALAMAFAALLNEEARELAVTGVDVIQFDEPAFNVYMDEVREWGIGALHRAVEGLACKTAVHICYGYDIKANLDWKTSLGAEWRQYEAIFPALAESRIDQVSVECAGAKVPVELLGLLKGKDVLLGAVDVASERVETPEEVAATTEQASRFIAAEWLYPCTSCGMAPMDRSVAISKLGALSAGAALARHRLGSRRR